MNNSKEILDHANQSAEEKSRKNPTGTLTTTFHKPMGEANIYVRFGYGLQKFSITSEENFQYQWMLIRSMQKNRSAIKDTSMTTKTTNNSN